MKLKQVIEAGIKYINYKKNNMDILKVVFLISVFFCRSLIFIEAQTINKLTVENISKELSETSKRLLTDSLRPGYHLVPHTGFMGDPNGGIYHDGWYHIFYLHNPFSNMPGPWYWGHTRSRDLMIWEHLNPSVTPAYDLGLNSVISGSTIISDKGEPIAIYSARDKESLKFWRTAGSIDLLDWQHKGTDPVILIDHQDMPKFDVRWRDPFVFKTGGRTFMIICADLFEEPYVAVPIFEAKDVDLITWVYKGILFSYPKNKLRNLEVPELRPIGQKWLLLASCDAPVDMTYCFVGDFDLESLKFTSSSEGPLDYSGHYYAQETIQDDKDNLFLMAWIPGWDRQWMPNYQDKNIKNTAHWWNGCFAIPRQLTLDADGNLIQQPVNSLKTLRTKHYAMSRTELPVKDVFTSYDVLKDFRGNQLEIGLVLEMGTASFCGINVLCDEKGHGGMWIMWSGNEINIDGIKVPIKGWKQGDFLRLQVFIDRQYVEVFINGGRYCITRKIKVENIKGDYVALTRLGGHAILKSLEGWKLKTINGN
jgi:beta-fructofuranosidase